MVCFCLITIKISREYTLGDHMLKFSSPQQLNKHLHYKETFDADHCKGIKPVKVSVNVSAVFNF